MQLADNIAVIANGTVKTLGTKDDVFPKLMSELGPNYNIRVVTGDRLLQFSAVHSGIIRVTAKEFEDEMIKVGNEINEYIKKFAESR